MRREAAVSEKQTLADRLEKDLQRERAVGTREQTVQAQAVKLSGSSVRRQHDLKRVAGLTADEAELLLKQIEADARHDAAT